MPVIRILNPLTLAMAMLPIMLPRATATAAEERPGPVVGVLKFVDAMVAGDAKALEQTIWAADGSTSQKLGRTALVKLVVAGKRLERAAEARFGREQQVFHYAFAPLFTAADRRALEQAQVFYSDRGVAKILRDGEAPDIRVCNTGSNWRVMLDVIVELQDESIGMELKPDKTTRTNLDRLDSMATAVEALSGRLEKGEVTSAEQATKELDAAMDTINAEAIRARQDIVARRGPGWNQQAR